MGFDPGGIGEGGRFGWSVCQADKYGLRCLKTGLAIDARDALCQVDNEMAGNQEVLAAGIDAPMFWGFRGYRVIDRKIQQVLKDNCKPSETVIHVNSLRGACSVQGVLLGKYLHETYPDLQITETHPTALRYLLKVCGKSGELEKIIEQVIEKFRTNEDAALKSEKLKKLMIKLNKDKRDVLKPGEFKKTIEKRYAHQRDAAISAYAAWKMLQKQEPDGWRNLYCKEPCPVKPFDTPVSYWMFIPKKEKKQ